MKARPPQVSNPGLAANGGTARGGEGLLGESQDAPLKKDESGGHGEETKSSTSTVWVRLSRR